MSVLYRFALTTFVVGVSLILVVPVALADDWGFYLSPGSWGISYNSGHGYYRPYYPPTYVAPSPPVGYQYQYPPVYQPGPYYPSYNPVVRRDVRDRGYYTPDGTFHSETTVEDRSASYYSPGRNEAITPPQTTVTQQYGPGGSNWTSERTTWIGADGRPHSTTVDRVTTQDIWGNTHTDTHVTLKKKPSTQPNPPAPSTPEAAPQAAPQQSP